MTDHSPRPDRAPGSWSDSTSPSEGSRPDVRWVRHRPPMGPLPRWGLVITAVLIAVGVGLNQFVDWVRDQTVPEGPTGAEVEFAIVEGWSTNEVVAALGDAGVVDNPAMFRQWMRCPAAIRWLIDCPTGREYTFQAGDYILREHLGFEATVALLQEGPLPPSAPEPLRREVDSKGRSQRHE